MTNQYCRSENVTGSELLLIVCTSAGWLLPNHYQPWNTFHTSAWITFFIFITCFFKLYKTKDSIGISIPAAGLLAFSIIPWVQHGIGNLPLFSSALMGWLFLTGFALAFVFGENWNSIQPGKPLEYVLTAACIASIVSVALQTVQWLGLTGDYGLTDIWIMQIGDGGRPFANIGQPNMLASLLLWGLLGIFLLYTTRKIGRFIALVLSMVILFGIALSESRTALLTLTIGIFLILATRPRVIERADRFRLLLLYGFYLILLFGQDYIASHFGLEAPLTIFDRSAGEIRTKLWAMSLDASAVQPWLGFGWGRTNAAFFEVWENHPAFSNLYSEQAHNIVLDIIIWVGWPLGILITLTALFWICRSARMIDSVEDLIAFSALTVMVIHAMLELPLHHAYFLIPFGILAGATSFTRNKSRIFVVSRKYAAILLVSIFAVFLIICRDYLAVEKSFTELRFQMARIGTNHDTSLPSTVLLKDWPRVLAFNRSTPQAGMSDTEIDDWKAMMLYNASPLSIRKLVGALILNGREAEGRQWARRACFLLAARACDSLADEWMAAKSTPRATPEGR